MHLLYRRSVNSGLLCSLASAGLTNQGRRRARNEDAVISLPSAGIFCVADGIGGAAGGDEASATAVLSLLDVFSRPDVDAGMVPFAQRKALALKAMDQACQSIHRNGVDQGYSQTGTTAVALIFDVEKMDRVSVLHAGDSRAYLLRDGDLEQMTRDHTMAETVGSTGTGEWSQGMRTMITRAVGVRPFVEMEITEMDVQPGDLFMLCSDGLTTMLTDSEILGILLRHDVRDLEPAIEHLIEQANKAGGRDNITVLLVRVMAADDPTSH